MTRDIEKTTPFVKDKKDKPAATAASALAMPKMFSHYEEAKHVKMPRWAPPLLGAALAIHVVIFVTMWVKTIWEVEQLDRPKSTSDIALGPPPPPPAAPPKGAQKPKDLQVVPKKIKVRDMVQPVHIDKDPVPTQDTNNDPNAIEGGEGTDTNSTVLDTPAVAPPPPPPPPPPAPPAALPPQVLEQSRIAGEKNITPDDVTKTEISRSGKDRISGTFKLCITAEGNIKSVRIMKPTGFPAYDSKISNTMNAEWRYRPVMINGKAVEACTAVTFIYSQS
jgi:periplasmic protein TonB